jgi:hypothetical protein
VNNEHARPKPSVWLTYAWKDNDHRDVDYFAQELETAGLEIKLDRWNLRAGERLWDQIAGFISEPAKSDAWMIFATTHSLSSEPCREELSYALDRALSVRGEAYPIIALFPSSIDSTILPPALRVRWCVSATERDWKERIVAAAQARDPNMKRQQLTPYEVIAHPVLERTAGRTRWNRP